MARTLISTIIDRPIRILTTGETQNGGWMLEIRDLNTDELIGTTDHESLFDKEGNYFEYDVD